MTTPAATGTNGDHADLADLFLRLGRELSASNRSVDDVLHIVSRRAYELVASAEHAAISRGSRGKFETVAATSDVPPLVDRIQYRLRTGPAVDAIHGDGACRVGDLSRNPSWPEFGRKAAEEYGIHSLLSVRMYLADDDLLAGLNLYSSARDAFDESDETTATLLAAHGALALTAARRQSKIVNLERALQTSRRIGTAMGILMASNTVTEQQAFNLLRIASQSNHRKLHDVADEVVQTGELRVPQAPEERHRD
jgi:GAF domain-containing protein